MTLLELHDAWSWVVVVGNALAGSWALAAHWATVLRRRLLWWFVAAAQLSIFVQVGLGVGLVAGQDMEAPQLHVFYGFASAIAVGILYSYRLQLAHRRYLLYGLGGLFLAGMGIRSMIVH